mmetsp:Transcript_13909/g.39724  ORF Transcript_13909/g.39724 Transcript_13909/m.39724 type:complete len:313 (-) Transcript_13909:237-1175(-)
MMKCLAGICGGGTGASAAELSAAAAKAAQEERRRIVKPEPRAVEAPTVASFEELVAGHNLVLAPPGAVKPCGVASQDFPQNVTRLLVLLPPEGAPEGAWDPSARGGAGDVAEVFRWAEANGYAACLFSSAALCADPAEVWDRVLRGSPAGSVTVLAAVGALPLLAKALSPVHALLFGRFRLVVSPFVGPGAWPPAWPSDLPEDLAKHLRSITVRAPDVWAADQTPEVVLQELFELVALREMRFDRLEARKYNGFQGLKENDMPGLRRLDAEQRIKRLDRDRGDDELARLLRENERAMADCRGKDDGDEPDVD